jgi:hypothetical protein
MPESGRTLRDPWCHPAFLTKTASLGLFQQAARAVVLRLVSRMQVLKVETLRMLGKYGTTAKPMKDQWKNGAVIASVILGGLLGHMLVAAAVTSGFFHLHFPAARHFIGPLYGFPG